ncbi:copper resistance CopC family protein [Oerskovia sp. M15]
MDGAGARARDAARGPGRRARRAGARPAADVARAADSARGPAARAACPAQTLDPCGRTVPRRDRPPAGPDHARATAARPARRPSFLTLPALARGRSTRPAAVRVPLRELVPRLIESYLHVFAHRPVPPGPPSPRGRRPRRSAPTGPARILVAALAALATLLATLLLGIGGATSAQAHDRIISSDPADGAQLAAAPAALTMTFSTEPLDVEPQVVVTDAAGAIVAQGNPTIEGTSATFPWPAELTGSTYSVAWRVVSSDGHPIEGTFSFSVAAAPEPVETTATEEPGLRRRRPRWTSRRPRRRRPLPRSPTPQGARSPLLIGIGVLAAAALVVAVLIVRRRSQQD